MSDRTSASTVGAHAFPALLLRQFSFPTPMRGAVEALVVSAVYLAAGIVALDVPFRTLLGPLVPVVLAMMLSSVASGVYRPEIRDRISNVFIHSTYGFALGAVAIVVTLSVVAPELLTLRFVSFFLFFGFFVINTVRPLLCGFDLDDRGGRRRR